MAVRTRAIRTRSRVVVTASELRARTSTNQLAGEVRNSHIHNCRARHMRNVGAVGAINIKTRISRVFTAAKLGA
tara:strand:+ start:1033 stop:1254 length:222 start_codon:yes stop_codon:yes gene_type:complete